MVIIQIQKILKLRYQAKEYRFLLYKRKVEEDKMIRGILQMHFNCFITGLVINIVKHFEGKVF